MKDAIIDIVVRSFVVSGAATLIASVCAVPLAIALCLREFKGKRAAVVVVRSMLSIPAVVIGLCCYLLFTRQGPMGPLRILYTPYAMIIAQAVLAWPIVLSLSYSGLEPVARPVSETLLTLGAGRAGMFLSLIYEARRPLFTALIMAFSRVVGETGMTMMVGGNIRGATRVMTTTIALETMKGNFELAVILGIILFCVAVIVNIVLHVIVGEAHAAPV